MTRDWSAPNAMAEWQAERDRERAITVTTGKSALERAFDKVDVVAYLEITKSVEMRATAFRSSFVYYFGQLEVIAPGLSTRSWPDTIRYLTSRIEHEIETRGRLWGSSQPAVNMLAARVVAREYAARDADEAASARKTMVAAE